MREMRHMQRFKRDELYSVPDLKERGWSPTMIKRFLPVHDDTRDNPFGPSQMRLYLKSRVGETERSTEWKAAKEKYLARQSGSSKAIGTKLRKTEERLEKLLDSVVVRKVTFAQIRELSYVTHAGNYLGECDYPGWSPRTAVNCIRHNYTSYDKTLYDLAGKVGVREFAQELKNAILDRIAAAYPTLAPECRAQQAGANTRHSEDFACAPDWDKDCLQRSLNP